MAVIFRDHKKDPDATLDWTMDWNEWLGPLETIAQSTWEVSPGITIVTESNTQKTAVVWLSGGTEGQVYRITNRITSSDGRIDDRSFTLRCTNR